MNAHRRLLSAATFVAAALLVAAFPVAAQNRSPLHDLGFMSGCWTGPDANGTTIEEHYTTPSNNLILGTTRYLRDGLTRSFEFTMIGNVAGGSHLIPHPGGKASVTFTEKERAADRVVWENLAHDFPQRIIYHRVAPDTLVARIESADGARGTSWRMSRAVCAP